MKTLDEEIEDEAIRRATESDAWLEKNKERLAAKAKSEHDRHVALGWINEDGSPANTEEDEEDEEATDDDA